MCVHFGIDSVENLVADRRNRFINRYGETIIYVNYCCADWFLCLGVFFCVSLISVCCIYSFILC